EDARVVIAAEARLHRDEALGLVVDAAERDLLVLRVRARELCDAEAAPRARPLVGDLARAVDRLALLAAARDGAGRLVGAAAASRSVRLFAALRGPRGGAERRARGSAVELLSAARRGGSGGLDGGRRRGRLVRRRFVRLRRRLAGCGGCRGGRRVGPARALRR